MSRGDRLKADDGCTAHWTADRPSALNVRYARRGGHERTGLHFLAIMLSKAREVLDDGGMDGRAHEPRPGGPVAGEWEAGKLGRWGGGRWNMANGITTTATDRAADSSRQPLRSCGLGGELPRCWGERWACCGRVIGRPAGVFFVPPPALLQVRIAHINDD